MDIDGREVTRSYLERQDLESVMNEIRKVATIDDLETFMLKHGENIVDMLGAEVDRIEANLRVCSIEGGAYTHLHWCLFLTQSFILYPTEKASVGATYRSRSVIKDAAVVRFVFAVHVLLLLFLA